MRVVPIALAAMLLLAALIPVAAGAEEETCRLIRGADTPADTNDDVQVCRDQVWIHQADTKVGNLAGQGYGVPGWDHEAPTASVTSGAGGGYLGSSLHQVSGAFDPTYTPAFEGTAEGPLDNVLIDLYLFPLQNMAEQAAGQAEGGTFSVDARLYVDGALVASHGGLPIDLEDAGDAVKRVRFAWVDLYTTALGDGTHDVRLEVVGTGLGSEAAVWVYDTTEVPSTLVFNATDDELDGIAGNYVPPF